MEKGIFVSRTRLRWLAVFMSVTLAFLVAGVFLYSTSILTGVALGEYVYPGRLAIHIGVAVVWGVTTVVGGYWWVWVLRTFTSASLHQDVEEAEVE